MLFCLVDHWRSSCFDVMLYWCTSILKPPMCQTHICICKRTAIFAGNAFALTECSAATEPTSAFVLSPSGIVLCSEPHHKLVLDQCTADLAAGTDCCSCLFAKAEPQRRKLWRLCAVMAVGGIVCMYFTSPFYTKQPGWSTKHFPQCWHLCHCSVCNTGAENGSSSQGAVGQSGPVPGSTGAMSKSSKGQACAEKEEQAGNQKRARRQWESWSAEDKNSFFEGLYEVKGRTTQ